MHSHRLLRIAVFSLLALTLLLLGAPSAPPTTQAQDGEVAFTVEETTFESLYPRGMVLTIAASSEVGEIERATLFMELRSGTRQRVQAELDSEGQAWIAQPYTDGGGIPPWLEFKTTWLLTDEAGNIFETEPEYVVYEDHTREWQSIETEDIALYWFGFSEDGEFGEMVAEAMATMRENYRQGWGENLDYTPFAIFFPDGEVWDEFRAGGNNSRAAGFTNTGWGYSVQRLASEHPPEFLAECVERWGYPTERSMERRLERAVATIVHEFVHVYQSEFRVGGPNWWVEGQADYFAGLTELDSDPNDRLSNLLSVTNDLPTLQGDGPPLALTVMAADSCNGLGYDMGNAFIRWLMNNYGGLETHHQIVELMSLNIPLPEALETVTGVSFIDLETQWRASWGLGLAAPPPTQQPFVFPTAPPMPGS